MKEYLTDDDKHTELLQQIISVHIINKKNNAGFLEKFKENFFFIFIYRNQYIFGE